MEWDVFGLGNALMDVLATVDDRPVVERHGLHRGTMHLVSHERWEGVYAEVRGGPVELHPGGSAANAVSTAARLGARATFCGLVGDDELGDAYEDRLGALFDAHFLRRRAGAPTGKCLSLVSRDDAERTMLTDLGAAPDLGPAELPWVEIARSRWLHLTGYLFTGGAIGDTAQQAMDHALRAGTRVSVDVGDAFVVDHFGGSLREVIARHADVVFMNREEGALLGGGDPLAGLRWASRYADVAVLKLGKAGSLIAAGDALVPVEAEAARAVDTTGAGDAYAGGFLFGLARGWDLARCGRLGSAVAAATVSQVGGVARDLQVLADIRQRFSG